jgi:membrane protease subunit HflK
VHWPAPIETHVVLPVEEQKQTRVGDGTGEALMLTGDENIAQIRFTVFWKINSLEPQNFLLNVDNPEALVQAVGESVMREVVGRRQLQPIITTERQALQTEVRNAVVALLEQYRAGVDVLDVQIQESDAPAQVIDAFRDVAAAEQDAATTINEAERYRSQKVPEARGEATKILNDAEAYREAEIAKARGDVARFLSVLEEYRKAPRVTRERLFLETMEKVLGRSEKIILDSDSNALPFLPLDRLMGAGNTTRTER